MPQVRYLVPYEVAFHSRDLKSGKPLTNTFYWRSGTASSSPPAYGAGIPGSDQATFFTNIRAAFGTYVLSFLNVNYQQLDATIRAIVGKQYKTPFVPILMLGSGAPLSIITAEPHGLSTGQAVFVQGVTSPPSANGNWIITVHSPVDFTLNGSNDALLWSGDGQFQPAVGAYQFTYADKSVQPVTGIGAVTGDALPLFASASIRRLNTGTGKNFRSRLSFGPMSESDGKDGKFDPTVRAGINTVMNAFLTGISNGGTDVGAGLSYQIAVSKKLASMQPPTFTSYFSWTAIVGSFITQPNFGSMLRRKPKLTAAIA